MPSNTTLNTGSGGDVIVTKQISHDGDTAKLQMVGLYGVTGTEDSYTATLVDADANGLKVSVGASALPSGASTAANQSTIIGHVDGIETLLGTIDADTSALAGAVAGTEVQVDIVGALPAGTNAIGKLAANSGVDIGDVDVTSVIPGTGATNLGKAVDSAAGATDTGIADLAIRDDALTTLTPVDGDYTNLRTNARGALWVALDSTAAQTVTLAAGTATNEIVGDVAQDAAVAGNPVLAGLRASTATPTAMSADGDAVYAWGDRNGATVVVGNVVDDAAFTPATNRVVPVGFLADETATDSVDEGDAGAARITLDRKLIVTPYAHAAAGGATPYKNLDVDETEDDIKTSAGKLFWLHAMNLSTGVRFLKIYDSTAASVTVGTTTPVLSFPIPTMADTNGAGFTIHFGDIGLSFATGICIAATTGVADSNTGAPGANEVVVNAGYL